MKKIILQLVIMVMVMSVLTGCGSSNGEKVSSTAEEAQIHTITYFGRPDEKGFETKIIKQFETENPNIKVNYVELPEDTDKKLQTINTILQAKDSSMDVFVGDVVWTPIFAAAGWVQPLDDYLTDDEINEHTPGSMKAYNYNNHIYGIPFFTDGGMLYYRKDLLEKYNKSVPITWNDLVETAAYIMEQENIPDLYGYAGSWKQYEGVTCNLTELVWSHGGDFLDNNGNVIFNSKESIEALQLMGDMVSKYKLTPDGISNFGSGDVRKLFANGQLIFSRDWPSFAKQANDPERSNVVGKVGYTVLPTVVDCENYSTLGGWGVMVSNFSEYKEEAVKFAKFRASYEVQKQEALDLAHLPTRVALYDDKEVQEALPFAKDMLPVMMSTKPRPQSPFYAELSGVLQLETQNVITGKKSAEEAVKYADEKMKKILGQ
jgi:multiple sugar transport system substrate-binding protein